MNVSLEFWNEQTQLSKMEKILKYNEKYNFFYTNLQLYKYTNCNKIVVILENYVKINLKTYGTNYFIIEVKRFIKNCFYKISLYKKSNRNSHTLKIEKIFN